MLFRSPRNYDGRVLLICARGQADAQREFWKPFMGDGLSIAESQADHKQMIRAPHAAFLAEQIDAWFGSGFPGADGARDTQKA